MVILYSLRKRLIVLESQSYYLQFTILIRGFNFKRITYKLLFIFEIILFIIKISISKFKKLNFLENGK